MTKFIAYLTSILVAIVALMAFALSYYTLQGVALANGLPVLLSYVWPLLVDFSLIVFSLTVVTANLHGESTWKQWALVGVYTAATIFFNTLHAWPALLPLLVSKILVTCVPPLSLFFSFELLMNQLKNSVTRNQKVQVLTQQVTILQEAIDNPISTRRQQVAQMLESHTQKAIAGELGVSISTVRNDIKALNGSVK